MFEHELKNAYIGEIYTSPSYTPTANTLLYLPLKWDINDYSWNNRNPTTVTGSVIFPNNRYGSFINYYWNMDSGYSDWTTNNSFTISYWIKDLGGTARPFVMGQDYWTAPSQWHWGLQAIISSNQITAYCVTNGSQQNTSAYSLTSWVRHNIIITITPWSQMKLYIDGNLEESVNVNSNMRIWAKSWIWLGRTNATSSYLNGNVSEIINENIAWSATDVTNYYNAHKWEYWL